MGYLTHHTLNVSHGSEDYEKLEAALLADDAAGQYGDLMQFIVGTNDDYKWYDHEEDMRRFSARFPDALFTLRGEGEEAGDLWIEYHKAGKMQRCNGKVVFEPYDEGKLC